MIGEMAEIGPNVLTKILELGAVQTCQVIMLQFAFYVETGYLYLEGVIQTGSRMILTYGSRQKWFMVSRCLRIDGTRTSLLRLEIHCGSAYHRKVMGLNYI